MQRQETHHRKNLGSVKTIELLISAIRGCHGRRLSQQRSRMASCVKKVAAWQLRAPSADGLSAICRPSKPVVYKNFSPTSRLRHQLVYPRP
jgi:hypothetical protein